MLTVISSCGVRADTKAARAGGFMEGKRRLKNLLKQIPALAELARSRR